MTAVPVGGAERDGTMMYRHLARKDAERFWALMDQLDRETRYMLYEPGERPHDLAQVEGVKRNSICLDGRYVDEYCMAKLLEEGTQ